MYGLALVLACAFWVSVGQGHSLSLGGCLYVSWISACGPMAWVALFSGPYAWKFVIFLLGPLSWVVWLTCVGRVPKLRSLPSFLHLLFGILWCASGAPPAGLAVT